MRKSLLGPRHSSGSQLDVTLAACREVAEEGVSRARSIFLFARELSGRCRAYAVEKVCDKRGMTVPLRACISEFGW